MSNIEEKLSQLSDKKLLKILNEEVEDYENETIEIVKGILSERGINYESMITENNNFPEDNNNLKCMQENNELGQKESFRGIGIVMSFHFIIFAYNTYLFITELIKYSNYGSNLRIGGIPYYFILITVISLSLNLIVLLGLRLHKKWAWWGSGILLVSQILTHIIKFVMTLFTIMRSSLLYEYDNFFSYNNMVDVYIAIILLFILGLLFHKHIISGFRLKKSSMVKRIFLLIGYGCLGFIFNYFSYLIISLI